MYLARFSYDISPAERQQALEFIRREATAARGRGLQARLLVPLTREHRGAALQFEVELTNLEQLEDFRQRGIDSDKKTSDWMHEFSKILRSPPIVEILRVDDK